MIKEISTIGEALHVLHHLTERAWTASEFASEILRLRLPLYAVAPPGASIVSHAYVDGRLIETPEPGLPANFATLLQDEIEELVFSHGPQIITDRPAWVYGDDPYEPWEAIQAFRAANHRVPPYWETCRGEWMGESSKYFFAEPFAVTIDSTLVVPRFAIAEIAEAYRRRSAGPEACQSGAVASEVGFAEATARSNVTTDISGVVDVNELAKCPAEARKRANAKKWDTHALRRLYEESLAPGVTHIELANAYGISRQVMSRRIQKAKEQNGPRKADAFGVLRQAARKK